MAKKKSKIPKPRSAIVYQASLKSATAAAGVHNTHKKYEPSVEEELAELEDLEAEVNDDIDSNEDKN